MCYIFTIGGKPLKKILSTFVVILLVGLVFNSTIIAEQQKSDRKDYFDIEVEFLGLDNYENKKINLSQEEFQRLTILINQIEEKKPAYTLDENRLFYNEILYEFAKILKLGEKTLNDIQKSFENIYLLNKILENKNVVITNYLCFISGQTTNSFFQTPIFSFLFVGVVPLELIATIFFILLFAQIFPILSMIIVSFISPFGSLIGHFLDFVLLNQQIMFGANIWLSNSKGWMQTVGLNGIKNNQGTFTGKITGKGLFYEMGKAWIYGYSEPYEPFIGVRGFTGLRLNIDSENYESFYIGTALLVDVH